MEGGGAMNEGIQDRIQELEVLAKPLIGFLETYYHPHCKIVIDNERVLIVQDVLSIPISEIEKAQPN